MTPQQVEMTGTVGPGGRLELDGPVALEPGRVTVTVRPLQAGPTPEPPKDAPFWQMMHSIWEGQKARGHVPRSAEEIDAEVGEARARWDEKQRGIERLQEESRRLREQAE